MQNIKKSNFLNILRSFSILGSLQLFNIFINILRSKIIAVFLGPSGIGVFGLISSSLGVVSGVSNFGLSISAVRNVTEANSTGDPLYLRNTLYIIKKVAWTTGMIGLFMTVIFSRKLSEIAFGSPIYKEWFVFLSISILINQINVSYIAFFQGIRNLGIIAKANFLSSIISFFLTVPLYYFFGLKSICVSIIITSFVTLICSLFFAKKLNFKTEKTSNKELFKGTLQMLKIGFLISLSFFLATASSYVVQIFITNVGGVEQVGLYLAGFAIVNNYVGIIFSAMATDYYPRLTMVSNDQIESKIIINQQAEITLLILAPILILFLIFIKLTVILLYSKDFLVINEMMYWSVIGVYFKSLGWPIAYYFLAKGDGKLYFINELLAVTYSTILSLVGYYFYGLNGLGIAYMISQAIYLVQCYLTTYINFNFQFEQQIFKISAVQILIALSAILLLYSQPNIYFFYTSGILLFITSLIYSFNEINKSSDLIFIFKKKFKA